MKDLTFIAEGNPDFFKGGLINLTKRRQVSPLNSWASVCIGAHGVTVTLIMFLRFNTQTLGSDQHVTCYDINTVDR